MPDDAYDRGVEAGAVLERLQGHDEHFKMINGSLERLANQAEVHTRHFQQLQELARENTRAAWTRWKLFAVTAGLATVLGIVSSVAALFR
jgi:hypothetical protein